MPATAAVRIPRSDAGAVAPTATLATATAVTPTTAIAHGRRPICQRAKRKRRSRTGRSMYRYDTTASTIVVPTRSPVSGSGDRPVRARGQPQEQRPMQHVHAVADEPEAAQRPRASRASAKAPARTPRRAMRRRPVSTRAGRRGTATRPATRAVTVIHTRNTSAGIPNPAASRDTGRGSRARLPRQRANTTASSAPTRNSSARVSVP